MSIDPALQLAQDHQTRGSFPNDDAALKFLSLAIKNAGLRWLGLSDRAAGAWIG